MVSKIKTFEGVCKAKGLVAKDILPDVSAYPTEHRKALIANAKLFLIVDFFNDGWKPNWKDSNEYKYYPWFDMEKSKSNPSGFRLDDVYYRYSRSIVGSRLCFKSRAIAEYVVKTFISLYKDSMIL